MTKKLRSIRNGLLIGLSIIAFFIIIALFTNWGIWRSLSYELTGIEFPLKIIYRQDTSNRGRELGFWVEVYQLPEHIQALLNEKRINLKEYPMFSGLEMDRYKRITWSHGFPRNDIENCIYVFFKKDISKSPMPTVESISNIEDAKDLANHLLRCPDTLCGGWYKGAKSDEHGVMITRYFFYIINIEKKVLIKFGLDT